MLVRLQRGDKVIIVDVTGTYVSRYYNKKTDFILNPLDIRSQFWHPWADCHLESHYDVLANSFIPENKYAKDPFWDNASRSVFKAALRKFASQGTFDIEHLTRFLLTSSDKKFDAFFKGTEAATLTSAKNEKTTQSIRSVLTSYIEGLGQLETINSPEVSSEPSLGAKSESNPVVSPGTGSGGTRPRETSLLSLRKWVMDEKQKGIIFITARSDQRQTLKPLISAWVDMAINALMVLPEDYTRRLWFIIDELAALQKLPSLSMGLAEGRKYGGCFLVGFQSKPQLEEIYGRQGAESMLDLFNTKIFFRCTEPSTQSWISRVLGDKEEIEPQENISYGANSMRDGVSLSHHTRQKPLVMPTELSQLEDLECYIKLPGDVPCTKLQMTYQTPSGSGVKPFLLKPEKKISYAEVEEIEKKQTVKKSKKKPAKQEVIVVPETSEEEKETLV